MDFEDLILSPKVGIKFVDAAKEVVRDSVKVKEEKEFKTIFNHRGFYGTVEYADMLTLITLRVSKKMKHGISDEDYELAKKVNKTGHYHGMLEINKSRSTCSAKTVLFLEADFSKDVFVKALNDCCDNLEAFFAEYEKKAGDDK